MVVDLPVLVGEVVTRWRKSVPGMAFTVLDDGLAVSAIPDRLSSVCDHIIDNAVDFSAAGDTITLRLILEPAFARLEVGA